MAKKKRIAKYKLPINLNAGIIIFGLVAIYLFINIVIFFTTEKIKFYEVVQGTNSDQTNKSYNGLVLRDEKIQFSNQAGYVDYFVRENSRISKNTTLYSIDSNGKLNDLLSEMSESNPSLNKQNISTISELLHDFSNNFDEMNFSDVYNFKSNIKGTVVDLINMNSLQNIAKESDIDFSINKSKSSGIVLYRVDDFETVKPEQLKRDMFNKADYRYAKFSSGDKVDAEAPIYKTLSNEEWHIAVCLTRSEVKYYNDKKAEYLKARNYTKEQIKNYTGSLGINIKFLKDGITTTAGFDIVKGADKKNYGIITLSKYMIRYATERFLDIQILDDITTGLKIPKTARVEKDFYIIPRKFGKAGGNDKEKIGFKIQSLTKDGQVVEEIYYPDITFHNTEYYYIEKSLFNKNDVILDFDSSESYFIGPTKKLDGVYKVNTGYTIFVQVHIQDTTDEYYIVTSENNYGLRNYDHIVLNADAVSETQILFLK